MKKILSIIFLLFLVFPSFAIANAKGVDSDSVTFFQSIENQQDLKSFRMDQVLSGNLKVNFDASEDVKEISGLFRFKIASDVINKKPYENNVLSRVNGHLNIHATGVKPPFNNLVINIKAQIISMFGDGVYFQLEDANLTASGVQEEDKDDYMEFRNGFNEGVKGMKGQWIYISDDYYDEQLSSEVPEELSQFTDTETIMKDLRDKGVKKFCEDTIEELFSALQTNGSLTDDEAKIFESVIDDFFSTQFFSFRTVRGGESKGLTSFSLSRQRVTGFIQKMTNALGEHLTADDLSQLRSYLDKFYLSGRYHVDNVNKIFDDFQIKLTLRDIEELTHLQVGYTYKISRINEIGTIKEPDEFTSINNAELPFLPAPVTEETVPMIDEEMGNAEDGGEMIIETPEQ